MICGECTERLDPSDFYRSNQATCKRCVRQRATERNRANRQAHRQATRRWREREKERAAIIEHVLQMMAARHERAFFLAVLDAEDTLGLDPGTAEKLFLRVDHRRRETT